MSVHDHIFVRNAPFSNLPPELLDALNQTYFLHLLVTEPHKVIPPGKSLLSMMTRAKLQVPENAQNQHKHAHIEHRVKEVAHMAFWNEIPRIRKLYLDLHESLVTLFPPNHHVLTSLSLPFPPTSSPLLSTLSFLAELVSALRQRCAPVRDAEVDILLESLSNPPQIITPLDGVAHSSTSSTASLAQFVIEKFKIILKLAENMKSDLNAFVFGTMTEDQLQGILLTEVKARERDLVLRIWGGKDVVRGKWRTWISDIPSTNPGIPVEHIWIKKLFQALESDRPIFCTLPSATPSRSADGQPLDNSETDEHPTQQKMNELPPQLFFSAPLFLYVQNCIQAIVISAVLRSLTRLSAPIPSRNTNPTLAQGAPPSEDNDFMMRIWTLLKGEIDEEHGNSHNNSEADQDLGEHTKVSNLAEEVIHARRQFLQRSPTSPELSTAEEQRLRDAVGRTLSYTDPVFQLLRKRLMNALQTQILSLSSSHTPIKTIPIKMQTGHNLLEERAGKRPRLNSPHSALPSTNSYLSREINWTTEARISGFDNVVLQQAIMEVLRKIVDAVGWVEGVWGDIV
ncbi:hypothetical protein JR316_0002354 [Psilocybe cubensis]|uniref:Uncharacterized protein n=1 Tax=Psilocybe cubensis TaxID=181762 RepID=A0ACB8HC53_PSICU|nr:hypothetical protein JR316_0002354 [Psilocybe cubensis]KAH9485446.1 hypothetical protein JR316_0002354 [Psilocybe cubensis]